MLYCTSRSTTLRVAAPALFKAAAGQVAIRLVDLNVLRGRDLHQFHDLIDSMGFWPDDLAKVTPDRRVDILQNKYDVAVSAIILKIFENVRVKRSNSKDLVCSKAAVKPNYRTLYS